MLKSVQQAFHRETRIEQTAKSEKQHFTISVREKFTVRRRNIP